MKHIIISSVICFILGQCVGNYSYSQNKENKNNCAPPNVILSLLDSSVQQQFFHKRDSMKQIQILGKDSVAFIDINSEIIDDFINSIDIDLFIKNHFFWKDYECLPNCLPGTDRRGWISLEYYPENWGCGFRLTIQNVYLEVYDDEPDKIYEIIAYEQMVVYGFDIINNKIVDFIRHLTG
jgi:hypothetical protein